MAVKHPSKKKPSWVFVPSKPWSAKERTKGISAGGKGVVPASFFEQVYIERGRKAKLGKKGLVAVSEKALNRVISNPGVKGNLKKLLSEISNERKIFLGEKVTLSCIDSITKILDHSKFTPEEFSFLEDLRISLIHYLIREFGNQA